MKALFIHGIGEFEKEDVLKRALQIKPKRARSIDVVYWADIMDEYERLLQYRYGRTSILDRALIMWFADAIGYVNKRDEILQRFLEVFNENKAYEMFIIAHSWGSIIALDAIHIFKLTDVSLITLGSPLPLYVAKIPSKEMLLSVFNFEITQPKKWINIYYTEDIFGFPLKDYGAEDYELSARCILCKIPFIGPFIGRFKSHSEYFKDKRVKNIINQL